MLYQKDWKSQALKLSLHWSPLGENDVDTLPSFTFSLCIFELIQTVDHYYDSLGGVSLSTNNACICFFLLRLFLKITRPQIRKHLYIHTAPVRLAAGGGAESESGVVGVVSGYA